MHALIPSDAEVSGRALLVFGSRAKSSVEKKKQWQGVPQPQLVELGQAADTVLGTDWRLETDNAVRSANAKALMTIVKLGVPTSWLVCAGGALGVDHLAILAEAIGKAKTTGIDWREWLSRSASEVITEVVPAILAPPAPAPDELDDDTKAGLEAFVEGGECVPGELPKLEPVVEAKPKRPSKSARKALRRQKAQERAAAARKSAKTPKAEAKAEERTAGHLKCTGRRGKCTTTATPEKMWVGTYRSVQRLLGVRFVTQEHLPKVCLCAECSGILQGRSFTVAAVIAKMDEQDEREAAEATKKAEAETRKAAEQAAFETREAPFLKKCAAAKELDHSVAARNGRMIARRLGLVTVFEREDFVALGHNEPKIKRSGLLNGRPVQRMDSVGAVLGFARNPRNWRSLSA